VTHTQPSDEEVLRELPDEVIALLSDRQRTALDGVLARLTAAERVCEMVKVSLSPKLRQAAEKKTHWWDVGIAIKQWEAVSGR
jgi:hypothetical protein